MFKFCADLHRPFFSNIVTVYYILYKIITFIIIYVSLPLLNGNYFQDMEINIS
jgi:hypothetical protein